ncbi:hypothetical protein [Zoogloea sp.]|uniref:hypothetical protein n=1 Tax=Zoogloea sp. TaxID=49181 RepID=UPI0035B3B199
MKEGSALLVALALAVGIAYWSDHFRATGGKPEPAAAPAFPYQTPPPRGRAPAAEHAVGPERLEVAPTPDVVAKALLCEELQEVIRGVDAALQTPQSPAATEQLNARRRAYVEKRMALGC